MAIKVKEVQLFRYDLKTRMPFKYGIAVMNELPHLFVELVAEINGRAFRGISADHLPPKWFTKIPEADPLDEVEEMLGVIRHAAEEVLILESDAVFDLWLQLYRAQGEWGKQRGLPPLLTHFGTSLMERALIDAWCRYRRRAFPDEVLENRMGISLQKVHDFSGLARPRDLLPEVPVQHIDVRHVVGLADWLTEGDIPDEERLRDGLPQSLESNIDRYGLTQFKIKVNGRLEEDLDRLRRIAGIIEGRCPDYAFSLDGNEQFKTVESFLSFWEQIPRDPLLSRFFNGLIFVEQPFHRDIALSEAIGKTLLDWDTRPTIIIDESDGDLGSLPRALQCGYAGTSHKNCKGVFKGIANRCLINHLNRTQAESKLMMSGEDLSNIGPVALLQDLAVQSVLGISSVERNGHQYFAGLSRFSRTTQEQVMTAHPDLYTTSEQGWPTLAIHEGKVATGSILRAPFGYGFEMGFGDLKPVWSSVP